jgi:[ribosomal protein S5]-alanine N-acetyltransferase
MVSIKGSKFTIRNYKLSDEESLSKNANNINIVRNLRDRFPYPYTIHHANDYINSAIKNNSTTYAIEVDLAAVGGIGAFFGENEHRKSVELGILQIYISN